MGKASGGGLLPLAKTTAPQMNKKMKMTMAMQLHVTYRYVGLSRIRVRSASEVAR